MIIKLDKRSKAYRDACKLVDSQVAEERAREVQVGGDQVNSPCHYTAGGIETIDFLRAKLTPEQLKGYYVGNLLKYISRAELKNGFEDYRKAQVYLSWLIELEGRAT